jgi:hypothetical protein
LEVISECAALFVCLNICTTNLLLNSDQFGNLQDPIDLSLLQKLKFMKHSTKVTWLVKFLKELLNTDTSEKIIVVSQFVDVIMKVGEILTNTRIPFQTCKFLSLSLCH